MPAVVGMGRMTLDVVVREGEAVCAQAGGTCGNVLAALAFLGWSAHAVGRVGDDDPGRRFVWDMERAGVDLSLMEVRGPTPVIVHHVGAAGHSFGVRCPYCDAALPPWEPIDAVALDRLPPASVFFFDRDSEAALLAARHYREQGALIVWEPSYAGPEVDVRGALAVCDVLKYSAETLSGFGDGLDVPLVIETHGEAGLRYRRERWAHLPAFRAPVTQDAGGCGDWVTAGFLHAHSRGADDTAALGFGMALAAWNAAFEGARGGMGAVGGAAFHRQVMATESSTTCAAVEPRLPGAGVFCRCRTGNQEAR